MTLIELSIGKVDYDRNWRLTVALLGLELTFSVVLHNHWKHPHFWIRARAWRWEFYRGWVKMGGRWQSDDVPF